MKRRLPQHLAWLAIVALILGPLSGVCTMEASASDETAQACPMGSDDGASCCCDEPCESPSGSDRPNPSDRCDQLQSFDDHWIPGPRVSVDRTFLPAVELAVLPDLLQPASVQQARAPWPVTYHPLIPPEAKSSLLAQGCALNT